MNEIQYQITKLIHSIHWKLLGIKLFFTKPSKDIKTWHAPSGRTYIISYCVYTKSHYIICPVCGRNSDCIGECCDKCREDAILWNYNKLWENYKND